MIFFMNFPMKDKPVRFFEGGGLMGELMRAYNWTEHPLGEPEQWPHSLQTTIRLILNSAYPMFLWWSKDLYMFHNDRYLPALGKKHPKALGASARVMWAEIWEQLGGIVENILSGGEPFYAENLLVPLERKGFMEETYWTFSYSPAYNDEGKIEGIFCACNEVTQTVLSERRLKTIKKISDSTIQIETVEQACKMACHFISQNDHDIPYSILYLINSDEAEARLYGYTGPLNKNSIQTSVKFDGEFARQCHLQEVVKSKRSVMISDFHNSIFDNEEVRKFQIKENVIFPILAPGEEKMIGFFISGINPRLEYDDAYKGFLQLLSSHIATAISSVQSRQKLIDQQGFLKEVFLQAPVAICILLGPEYVVDLANKKILELWGKNEDVIGKPLLQGLPEVKDQGIIQLLDGVYYTGVPFVANELGVDLERNGKMERMFFSFVYHPFRDINGKITGVIAVAVSVNEQVEARREIEAMNKELLAINADLDNFVYSASHDLKAPISNIEGLMKALIKLLPPEVKEMERIKKVVHLIEKSIDRFKKTVNDLSEVTKLQRESNEDIGNINLPDVIEEVELDLESQINDASAIIDKVYEEYLSLNFSAKNLRSIVYNLMSNAVKYRSPERQLIIRIKIYKAGDYMILEVSDNGLGMDLTDESKIFSMFKRLHDHVEGSGVGLYIVKKIIENAGGKIEVQSEVNKGSTFRVFFKL